MIDDINSAQNIVQMNLFNKFKQNNLFDDAIISFFLMCALSFLSYFTQKLYIKFMTQFSLRYIYELWNSLFSNSIKLVGTKYVGNKWVDVKLDYSIKFLGVIHRISKLQKNSNITHLKEITVGENRFRIGKSINSIFIPEQTRPFKFNKDIYGKLVINNDENEGNNKSYTKTTNFEITLFSTTLGYKGISDFIDECVKEYEEFIQTDVITQQYYFSIDKFDEDMDEIKYNEIIYKSGANFDNLFFENKKILLERLDFFLNNYSWYRKRGIPHRLGIMLHGTPGCGKTSIIKAIANLTGRHIISINLNKIKKKRDLEMIFYNPEINEKKIGLKDKIFVIEDIDCNGLDIIMDREKKYKNLNDNSKNDSENFCDVSQGENIYKNLNELKKMDMNKVNLQSNNDDDNINLANILEIMDGVQEMEGRLLIITTNYPNKLDSALIRPGRIDLKLELKKANSDVIESIFENSYKDISDDKTYSKGLENIKQIKDYSLSPAEINKEILNSPYDAINASLNLLNFSKNY